MNLGKLIADIFRPKKDAAQNINAAPQISTQLTSVNDEPPVQQTAPNTSLRPRIVPTSQPPQSDFPPIETLGSSNIPPDTIKVPERRTLDNVMANLAPIRDAQAAPEVSEMQADAVAPNTSIRPRIAGNTRQWEIDQNRQMMNDPALENIPENKPKRWKAALAVGLKNIADTIRAGGSLGQALGAGGGSAIGGAIAPKLYADQMHQHRIDRLQQEDDADFKNRERELGLEGKQAQIDYTRQRPEIEREKLRNKIELEQQKQQNKIANLKLQNANKEDDWDPFIKNGKVWKVYKKRDGSDGRKIIEPLIDPDTGAQMEPAEDKLYDYYDSYSGNTLKAKGREILGAAIANASRETSVNMANTASANRYQNELFEWQNKVDSYSSDYSLKNEELNGLNKKDGELKAREDALTQEMQGLQGDLYRADELKQKQSELEKIKNERTNLIAQSQAKQGELQKSLEQMEKLKKNRPKPPTQANAVTTGAGGKYAGQIFASPSSLRSYFPGKDDDDIKKIVEANGGKFNQ